MKFVARVLAADGSPLAEGTAELVDAAGPTATGKIKQGALSLTAEPGPAWGLSIDGKPVIAVVVKADAKRVDLGDIALVSDAILETFKGAIVLCPPSAIADRWSRRFAEPIPAMASGWMGVRARARQRGAELPLIISDHADWSELCQTLKDVGAPKVWVTHGREEALVHMARSIGIEAEALHLAGREEEDES